MLEMDKQEQCPKTENKSNDKCQVLRSYSKKHNQDLRPRVMLMALLKRILSTKHAKPLGSWVANHGKTTGQQQAIESQRSP